MIKRNGITVDSEHRRKIQYLSRDFVSIRNEMNRYILEVFPEAVGADFSENSGAQVFVELIAYVGDILSFYTDKSFNELILDRVVEKENAYGLAKGLGYQPQAIKPSLAELTISFDLPVTGSLTSQYFFNLAKGTKFLTSSTKSITFENLEALLFNRETANTYDSQITTGKLGIPVTRFTKQGVRILSGETRTISVNINAPSNFRKIHIPNGGQPINEVLSVVDSDGNTWYRVKNLAQEYIFTGIPNLDTDNIDVPFILSVKRVPRRFVVEFNDDGSAEVVFGSGEIDLTDTEFILSPENIVFPNKTIGKFLDFNPDSIKLEDFLNTTSLGVAPSDTKMVITYRVGGGIKDNIGANRITRIQDANVQFYSLALNQLERQYVLDSMVVFNPEPSQGGEEAESIDQIKVNASYWYAAQDRVVSIEDYVARVATIPPQYGNVYKITASHGKNLSYNIMNQLTEKIDKLVNSRANGIDDQTMANEIRNLNESVKNNASDVKLHVICRNTAGQLQKATNTLKKNMLTYLNQFKVASDTLEIDDVKILNLGCRFTVHVDTANYKPSEVQLNVMNYIGSYLDLSNMNIGKDINIDNLRVGIMNNIKGIISLPELVFFVISGVVDGRQYSNDFFNSTINDFLSFNGTIIECPIGTMIECKYGKTDILGRFAD